MEQIVESDGSDDQQSSDSQHDDDGDEELKASPDIRDDQVVEQVESGSQSGESAHKDSPAQDLEHQEKQSYYYNMGIFTPRRLMNAALATPIRTMISSRNPKYTVARKQDATRHGEALVWFVLGVANSILVQVHVYFNIPLRERGKLCVSMVFSVGE